MTIIGKAFAPSNIALCKYWGKRDTDLNLPVNSSLSISLGDHGANTSVSIINLNNNKNKIINKIILNNNLITEQDLFFKKISNFLKLLQCKFKLIPDNIYLNIETSSNIPIAAGLASSACGFAALVQALNQLFAWNLSLKELSILARLGSGSASRSLWHGFVKWHKGIQVDGLDSFAEPIDVIWPELCVGLLILDRTQKYIGSREAMQHSVATSPLYKAWPEVAIRDLDSLETAIHTKDFALLGSVSEANALAMHAIMLSSRSAIMYSTADTINTIKQIWDLRNYNNIPVYFTQDAGPNLKLLFLYTDFIAIKKIFNNLILIRPFAV